MNFEYLNVSVAQKLTELRFFLDQQLLTAVIQVIVTENQCYRPCMKKLIYQIIQEIY